MSQVIARGVHAIVGHPWLVIATWVVAIAAAAVFLVPSLGNVPQAGLSLPGSADSVRAQNLLQQHFPHQSHPDTMPVVLVDDHGLQIRDAQIATRLGDWFRQQSFTSSVAPPVRSGTEGRSSSRSRSPRGRTSPPTGPRSSATSGASISPAACR